MDISQLTDTELRDSLKSHGVSTGPIVASTRKVYEKKLLKLIGNGTSNQSRNHQASSNLLNASQLLNENIKGDNDVDTAAAAAEEEIFEPIFKKKSSPIKKLTTRDVFQSSSSSAAAPSPIPASPAEDSDDCEESMRYLTEEEMAADRAAARQALQSNEKKGEGFLGGMITYGLVFLVIAVFIYFLIENAEQVMMVPPNSDDVV